MKPGVRAVGVAESTTSSADRSTLAGAVVRADRTTDGFALGTCTVGGTDATRAIGDLYDRLDREDIRYVLLAGVALAWYNIVDIEALHDRVDRPVLSVSFEESAGLTEAIRDGVENPRPRVATYEALPDREPVTINGERRFVRSIGCSDPSAEEVLSAFTPDGGRPEPLRVARLLARTADTWRHERKG